MLLLLEDCKKLSIDFLFIFLNISSFCSCGENRGRVETHDGKEALVRFKSISSALGGGAGSSKGFLLNVYATCGRTKATTLKNSCRISSTGFEICSGVSVPLCRKFILCLSILHFIFISPAADNAEHIEPM